MPSRSGTDPGGRRRQSARSATRPSACAAASGNANDGIVRRPSVAPERVGHAGLAEEARRRPACRSPTRPRARSRGRRPRRGSRAAGRRSRAPRRSTRRRARCAARPRTARRSRPRRGRPGCAPSRRREAICAQRVLRGRVELGDLEPGARARVGREDARAARVADDRDPAPGGQRLVREHHRGREQLVERVDPDHAGLAEQRVDRDVGRGERGGVRRRGAAPGRRPPALHRDDRLRRAPGCARAARTCAGSRTTRGTGGSPRSAGRRPSTAAGRCR